jgi:hypothetical protein
MLHLPQVNESILTVDCYILSVISSIFAESSSAAKQLSDSSGRPHRSLKRNPRYDSDESSERKETKPTLKSVDKSK